MLSKKLQLLEYTTANLVKAVAIGMACALAGAGVCAQPTNPTLPKPSVPNPSVPTVTPAPNLDIRPTGDNPTQPSDNQSKSIKVDTTSGASETALVEYLAAKNVIFYGAYWCDHCQKQKSLFGATAATKLTYIECSVDGDNSQRKLCKERNIKMFPTWEIDGKYYPGTKDLKELAKLSGYRGPTNFKYQK
ncbi:glutaredoxin family protein [Chamaesiphon minutus]|uniref:Thioredoxin n=1 Tax=Chamaesiphon minutus (strain ATCC 27169 / PCC 6605) TaxID=1173020 RepID=K9UHK2_CHAP6|nr:thioredoxin [Chamaesiphon minutus]AFY93926.1 Thioredoxin [Chamaesiphon minutus PCC 6605]